MADKKEPRQRRISAAQAAARKKASERRWREDEAAAKKAEEDKKRKEGEAQRASHGVAGAQRDLNEQGQTSLQEALTKLSRGDAEGAEVGGPQVGVVRADGDAEGGRPVDGALKAGAAAEAAGGHVGGGALLKGGGGGLLGGGHGGFLLPGGWRG